MMAVYGQHNHKGDHVMHLMIFTVSVLHSSYCLGSNIHRYLFERLILQDPLGVVSGVQHSYSTDAHILHTVTSVW